MPDERAYETKQDIILDTTGISYSDVFNFSGFNNANQLEVKVNVTVWDGSIDFSVEASDDGATWFEVEDTDFTIAAVAKKWIFFNAVGNFMRVKMDYTHSTTDTELTLFNLVR